MEIGIRIFLILFLILINAFFAGSEAALVAANEMKVNTEAKNNKRAKLTLRYINNSTSFLSTIQVGITFIGFINGFLAAESFTQPILNFLGTNFVNSAIWAVVVKITITLLLTYLQVVFGELLPKKIAIQNPEKFIYKTIGSLHFINKLLSPLVWLFTKSANLISRVIGIKDEKDEITENEIRMIIAGSGNAIKEQEKEFFEKILDFDDQDVSDVMTHRTEIVGFNINDSYDSLIKLIKESQYSRVPVYENNIDNILGVLYTKDIVTKNINSNNFNIKSIIRKTFYVPEVMKTSNLFKQMQKNKIHLAIVVDEFGGTSGIVTMEDILEEIFGEIFDEYDEVINDVEQIAPNVYLVDGLASIDDVDDIIDAGLPIDDFDTLSGFILDQLGRMPEENEQIEIVYNNFLYEVVKYDENVIDEIKVTKLENSEEEK